MNFQNSNAYLLSLLIFINCFITVQITHLFIFTKNHHQEAQSRPLVPLVLDLQPIV